MQSGPMWEKDRYISFVGDPIGPDGKVASGVSSLNSPIVRYSALAAFTLTAIFKYTMDDKSFSAYLMTYPVLGGASGWFIKESFARDYSLLFDNKCVDTNPDKHSIRSNEYGAFAEKISQGYGRGLAILSLPLTAGVAFSNNSVGQSLLTAIVTACVSVFYCRRIFNKIAKDEWAIVDMPRPQKLKEKAPEKMGDPVLAPIPMHY